MDLLLKIITALSAATAATVAARGLQTWRAQLVGKTEYELARRLLRGVLEVRDQIAAVRGPFMSAGEMDAALKAEGLERKPGFPDRDDQRKATLLAYNRRWAGVTKAVADVRADLLEAEVLWGQPVQDAYGKLANCVGELYSSLELYLRAEGNPRLDLGDNYEKHFAVVYQTSTDPTKDKFLGQVTAAVHEFERILRPHLSVGTAKRLSARSAAFRSPPA